MTDYKIIMTVMSELEDLPIISQKEYDEAYSKMLTAGIPSNQAKVLAKFAERLWHNEEFAEAFKSGDYIKLQKIIESEKGSNNDKRIKCHNPILLILSKIKGWFS